jgi:hypothetical protein
VSERENVCESENVSLSLSWLMMIPSCLCGVAVAHRHTIVSPIEIATKDSQHSATPTFCRNSFRPILRGYPVARLVLDSQSKESLTGRSLPTISESYSHGHTVLYGEYGQ